LFARHLQLERAIEAAWRRILRHWAEPVISLKPFVEQVMVKCQGGGEETAIYVRRELERRYWHCVYENEKDSKATRNRRIFEMWMACYTQEEIAAACESGKATAGFRPGYCFG
jgi:hypothetical protein